MHEPRVPAQQDGTAAGERTAARGTLWTIGHSTHTIAAVIELLQAHGIETVVDVRRFPGSRRHPQFGGEALAASLATEGIHYQWVAALGGRRKPDFEDPEGSAWRHPSFRAYAQYLRSEAFAEGLALLQHVASATRTAVMCSELLWWRCHRRLIADAMVVEGWEVGHVLGMDACSVHRVGAPASVGPDGLSYAEDSRTGDEGCCRDR